jgi:hypothetical protein
MPRQPRHPVLLVIVLLIQSARAIASCDVFVGGAKPVRHLVRDNLGEGGRPDSYGHATTFKSSLHKVGPHKSPAPFPNHKSSIVNHKWRPRQPRP